MDEFIIIENEPSSLCPICLDKKGVQKIKMECGHKIHPNCLKYYLSELSELSELNDTNDKKTPCCKKPMNNYNFICSCCKNNTKGLKFHLNNGNIICFDCISFIF